MAFTTTFIICHYTYISTYVHTYIHIQGGRKLGLQSLCWQLIIEHKHASDIIQSMFDLSGAQNVLAKYCNILQTSQGRSLTQCGTNFDRYQYL